MRILALFLALPLALTACASNDSPAEPAAAPAESSMDAGRVSVDAEADAGHTEVAPHDGVVAEAGEGHLELVRSGQTIQIYPLDDMALPVSADGITGASAVLHPTGGGADQTLPLTLMGDHLMATVPAGVTDYALDVTVPMAGGERREGHFDAAGEAAGHDEAGHDEAGHDDDGHTH